MVKFCNYTNNIGVISKDLTGVMKVLSIMSSLRSISIILELGDVIFGESRSQLGGRFNYV